MSTAFGLPLTDLAARLSSRWCQENSYRLFLHHALLVTSPPAEYGMAQLLTLQEAGPQSLEVDPGHTSHPFCNAERVFCEVDGRPIVAVLASSLSAVAWAFPDGLAVSPRKVARHVRAVATNWALAVMAGTTGASLSSLCRLLSGFCRKTRQKRRPAIEVSLNQALPEISRELAQQSLTPWLTGHAPQAPSRVREGPRGCPVAAADPAIPARTVSWNTPECHLKRGYPVGIVTIDLNREGRGLRSKRAFGLTMGNGTGASLVASTGVSLYESE